MHIDFIITLFSRPEIKKFLHEYLSKNALEGFSYYINSRYNNDSFECQLMEALDESLFDLCDYYRYEYDSSSVMDSFVKSMASLSEIKSQNELRNTFYEAVGKITSEIDDEAFEYWVVLFRKHATEPKHALLIYFLSDQNQIEILNVDRRINALVNAKMIFDKSAVCKKILAEITDLSQKMHKNDIPKELRLEYSIKINEDEVLLKQVMLTVFDLYERFESIEHFTPYMEKARQHFLEGNFSESEDLLVDDYIDNEVLTARTISPQAAEAYMIKAYLRLTDISDVERFNIARKYFQKAIDYDPTPNNLCQFASFLCLLQDFESSVPLYTQALAKYRELASENPTAYSKDIAKTLNDIGSIHQRNADFDAAVSVCQEALNIYYELAEENPAVFKPHVADALTNLADLHSMNDSPKEAVDKCQEALNIYYELAGEINTANKLNEARMLYNTANTNSNRSEGYIAIQKYTDALKIGRELAEDDLVAWPEIALALNRLSTLHCFVGEFRMGLIESQASLDIRIELASIDPTAFSPLVADSLNSLAAMHQLNGNTKTALSESQKALEAYRILAAENPAAFNDGAATALYNNALLHEMNGDYDEALDKYREFIIEGNALRREKPPAYNGSPILADALYNVAVTHQNNGSFREGLEVCQEALKIYRALAQKSPGLFNACIADALNTQAVLLDMDGKLNEALASSQEALAIYRVLAKEKPSLYSLNLASTYNSLADLHKKNDDLKAAIKGYIEAIALVEPYAAIYPGTVWKEFLTSFINNLEKVQTKN